MVNRKKKGTSGEAAKYISRAKAIRKLQLNLLNFNRLCIIKGIYPIEPKNRIKAQGGDSKYRPLYLKKDIKFLLHDNLIWTMRDESSSFKKLRSAKHLKSVTKIATIKRNKPIYRLDQNVLERYPTFLDAVKDLSDPLTMVFLFAHLGALRPVEEHHVTRCQRLRTEFLTYLIEARCLTKAFISTRGYYYEAEILGRRIVWTAPHNCVTTVPANADIRIMKNFLEFNIAMLGFVNFRLLGKVNFRYPLMPAQTPKFSAADKKDLDNYKNLIASLNFPLLRTIEKPEPTEDDDDTAATEEAQELLKGSTETTQKAYSGTLENELRRKLFAGLKFFIGMEANRESLTLVIKSCGGEVSWPSTMFPCSTYNEEDQSITHQIVDRPSFEKTYISRYYVQPQYVYDCLNAATLKPCQPYLPGADLPPHVCPFLRNTDGWYVPPEEEILRKLVEATPEEKEKILDELSQEEQQKMFMIRQLEADHDSDDEEDADMDEDTAALMKDDEEEEEVEEEEDAEDEEETQDEAVEATPEVEDEDDVKTPDMEVDAGDEKPADKKIPEKKKKVEIRRGRELIIVEKTEVSKELRNDEKMRAMMIPNQNRKLYHKFQKREKKLERRSSYLKDRREAIEAHKLGKVTQEELDYPADRKIKLTYGEKKKLRMKEKVKSAVEFAKSPANKYRPKNVK